MSFTESIAAKLWGDLDGRQVKFANARKGHPFRIIAIFGGEAAEAQIVVTSADGLRLYLHPDQAKMILVETETAASA